MGAFRVEATAEDIEEWPEYGVATVILYPPNTDPTAGCDPGGGELHIPQGKFFGRQAGASSASPKA
jgi:hypothetical protein